MGHRWQPSSQRDNNIFFSLSYVIIKTQRWHVQNMAFDRQLAIVLKVSRNQKLNAGLRLSTFNSPIYLRICSYYTYKDAFLAKISRNTLVYSLQESLQGSKERHVRDDASIRCLTGFSDSQIRIDYRQIAGTPCRRHSMHFLLASILFQVVP